MLDIKEHYKKIVEWNQKAGNQFYHHDDIQFWRAVENQAKLVVEEAKETLEAASRGDAVELIDGLADIMVTFSFLVELAYQADFDTDLAMDLVNKNNDTKIFRTYTKAKETLDYYEEHGLKGVKQEGLHIEEVTHKGGKYYTVRNGARKILKPIDFVSVDLSECVPE